MVVAVTVRWLALCNTVWTFDTGVGSSLIVFSIEAGGKCCNVVFYANLRHKSATARGCKFSCWGTFILSREVEVCIRTLILGRQGKIALALHASCFAVLEILTISSDLIKRPSVSLSDFKIRSIIIQWAQPDAHIKATSQITSPQTCWTARRLLIHHRLRVPSPLPLSEWVSPLFLSLYRCMQRSDLMNGRMSMARTSQQSLSAVGRTQGEKGWLVRVPP